MRLYEDEDGDVVTRDEVIARLASELTGLSSDQIDEDDLEYLCDLLCVGVSPIDGGQQDAA